MKIWFCSRTAWTIVAGYLVVGDRSEEEMKTNQSVRDDEKGSSNCTAELSTVPVLLRLTNKRTNTWSIDYEMYRQMITVSSHPYLRRSRQETVNGHVGHCSQQDAVDGHDESQSAVQGRPHHVQSCSDSTKTGKY
jgi:hypothetical protein